VNLDLVLFIGVFYGFCHKNSQQEVGRPFTLFPPFTKGFHTSSSSTSAMWGFSFVKLLNRILTTVISWSLHFQDLSHNPVVSVFRVTISNYYSQVAKRVVVGFGKNRKC